MNQQAPLSPKGSEGSGLIVQKQKTKALRAARPNPTSAARAFSSQHAAGTENVETQVKSLPAILRDQMKAKDDEIDNLRLKLAESMSTFEDFKTSSERSRTESSDYATHLEEEVEISKASIAEAADAMQALEQDIVDKDRLLDAARADTQNSMQKLQDLELLCQERNKQITILKKEIESLTLVSKKAQKEAEEYATHLEEEVEISKVLLFPAVVLLSCTLPHICTIYHFC